MAYCTNCGTEEREDQRFCTVCGAPKAGTVYASPMPLVARDGVSEGAQVRVGVSLSPPRQSRWTVLFRLFMAIPLCFFALIIWIAASFVTIIAWFCALFTGRVSDGLQEFLTSALRLSANVGAYLLLLTARWPGFRLEARADDQVTIDIDHVRLRRWSVFFRFILVYPASIVGGVLTGGTYLVLMIVWVATLVSGRAPRTLHQALALVWRFQIRLQAYTTLLTPTQPFRGLFGDGEEQASPASSAAAAVSPSFTSQLAATPTNPLMFPGVSTVGAPVEKVPLPTRWVVAKAAKNSVVIVIVLGALFYFFSNLITQPLLLRVETAFARSTINSSHADIVKAMHQFAVDSQSCPTTGSVSCLAAAAEVAHVQIARQDSTLFVSTFVPQQYRSLALSYEAAINVLAIEMAQLRDSNSITFDRSLVNNELPRAIAQVNRSYERLHLQLG